MKITLLSDTAPTHPELGEIVIQADTTPARLPSSFYRTSSQTVVSLTQAITLRTLQNDAVPRGREVMMAETLFHGLAGCSGCHSTADFTGAKMFTAITSPQGDLSGGIHVPSLRGISHTAPYFSDGSATTLEEAIQTLMTNLTQVPLLTATQQENLEEHLKSF